MSLNQRPFVLKGSFFLFIIISFWLHRVFVVACGPPLVTRVRAALVAVRGLLIAAAPLIAEHGL